MAEMAIRFADGRVQMIPVDMIHWAQRWGVPDEALTEFRHMLGAIDTSPPETIERSEAAVQNDVRIEASQKGARLWRNNVGAYVTPEGSFVRYGLANDTIQMNKIIKSSDLIGIKPVRITQRHVGQLIGQFLAREVKRGDWEYHGNDREQAQLQFIKLVTSLGGDAAFATQAGSIDDPEAVVI